MQYTERLFSEEFCDEIRLGIHGISSPNMRCTPYDAWCAVDTDGPPEITEYRYALGLGETFRETRRNGFSMFLSYSETSELIFYTKDGVSCGEEAFLSTTQESLDAQFNVFPNPSSGMVNINQISSPSKKGTLKIEEIRIADLSGRSVLSFPWRSENDMYDLSGLAKGVYVIHLVESQKAVATKKLVLK